MEATRYSRQPKELGLPLPPQWLDPLQHRVALSQQVVAGQPDGLLKSRGAEAVVNHAGNLQELEGMRLTGIHYKPKADNFMGGIDAIAQTMAETGALPGNYISVHLDAVSTDVRNAINSKDLTDPRYIEGIRNFFRQTGEIASKYNIRILFENIAPGMDTDVPQWCYDFGEFRRMFGDLFPENGRLGFCPDLTHLMMSGHWKRTFRTVMEGRPLFPDEEEMLGGLRWAAARSGEIHVSNLQNHPIMDQWIFKKASDVKRRHMPVVSRLAGRAFPLVHNLLFEHKSFSGSSEEEMLPAIVNFLESAGFKGVYVVEENILAQLYQRGLRPQALLGLAPLKDYQAIGDCLRQAAVSV